MSNKKICIRSMSGCFGCIVSFLDVRTENIELFDKLVIKTSPLNDEKEIVDTNIGIVEGFVSTDEDIEIAKKFREHSEYIIALGSCSVYGGIGGLRNLVKKEDLLKRIYQDGISIVEGKIPSSKELPFLNEKIKPLSEIIKIDYTVPGCPPPKELIKEVLMHILFGTEIKERNKNICIECGRKKKGILEPQRGFLSERVSAVMELDNIDPEICLIEQGILCLGPVTMEGCGARCLSYNIPCRGCLGPPKQLYDQGAKLIDVIATLLPAGALMFMDDIVGTGYRFTII